MERESIGVDGSERSHMSLGPQPQSTFCAPLLRDGDSEKPRNNNYSQLFSNYQRSFLQSYDCVVGVFAELSNSERILLPSTVPDNTEYHCSHRLCNEEDVSGLDSNRVKEALNRKAEWRIISYEQLCWK